MQISRNTVNGQKTCGNSGYRLRPETTSPHFADPPSTTHV